MSDELWIDIKSSRDIRLFLWLNEDDVAIYNYRLKDSSKKYSADLIYGEDYRLAAEAINDAFRLFIKTQIYFVHMHLILKSQRCNVAIKRIHLV